MKQRRLERVVIDVSYHPLFLFPIFKCQVEHKNPRLDLKVIVEMWLTVILFHWPEWKRASGEVDMIRSLLVRIAVDIFYSICHAIYKNWCLPKVHSAS